MMRKGWKIGNFWYFQALDSPKGPFNIFHNHIQLIFALSHKIDPNFLRIVLDYWTINAKEFISAKL